MVNDARYCAVEGVRRVEKSASNLGLPTTLGVLPAVLRLLPRIGTDRTFGNGM